VSLNNTYHRILAVVPMTGSGTAADPQRPMFAPAPRAMAARPARTALLAWNYLSSDDGKWALVEFVAADRAAFAAILADKRYRVFEKGKAKKAGVETEFRKYRKNFDLNRLGVFLP
jgi:hypothetical protein